MSLRLRVVFANAFVLVIGELTGIGVAGWQARQVLREELGAALAGGRQAAAAAFEDLPTSNHSALYLRRLVVAFDGDRHLVAVLHDAGGRIVARSRPLASRRAPGSWPRSMSPFRPSSSPSL